MDLRRYLGRTVQVAIDRPAGSRHPQHTFVYELNYGFVPGTLAADGEPLDAYVVGTKEPLATATGRCIALVHRQDDDDDKLVVALPGAEKLTDDDIGRLVHFQEQWFRSEIVRGTSR